MQVQIRIKEDFEEAWQLTLTEINWLFILSLFNLLVRYMPEDILEWVGPQTWGIIILLTNLALFFFFLLDVRNAVTRGDWRSPLEGAKHYGLRYAGLGLLIGALGSVSVFLPWRAGGWGVTAVLFAYAVPSLLVEDVGIFQSLWRSLLFIAKNWLEHLLILLSLAVLGFVVSAASGAMGMLGGLLLGLYSAFAVILFFVFYANRFMRMSEPGARRWILW